MFFSRLKFNFTTWLNVLAAERSSSTSDVNNCYTIHDVGSTWNARNASRDMGAHLVTMETQEEWNKLKWKLVSSQKKWESGSYTHYYVGLRKEKGTWKWTEAGSPGVTVATDDSRWQSDQPTVDLDPRQASGEIWYPKTGLKGLNDILCDLKFRITRGYICERYQRFVFNQKLLTASSNCFMTTLLKARFYMLRQLPPCLYSLSLWLCWFLLLKQFIRHDMAYFATAKLKSVHSLLSLFSILTTIFMFSTVSEGIPCLSTARVSKNMWQLIISHGSQLISQEISSDSLVAGERYFCAFKLLHLVMLFTLIQLWQSWIWVNISKCIVKSKCR